MGRSRLSVGQARMWGTAWAEEEAWLDAFRLRQVECYELF
jgi:hypothetical protein